MELIEKITGQVFIPPYTAIGVEKNGEVIGGMIFNVFEGADVHITAAGSGISKGFLADVGNYVFSQLQCERMTAITEQPRIVRMAEKLGGKIEGCLRNHYGKGRDGFIVGILKDEYKF